MLTVAWVCYAEVTTLTVPDLDLQAQAVPHSGAAYLPYSLAMTLWHGGMHMSHVTHTFSLKYIFFLGSTLSVHLTDVQVSLA